jgi:hypothetical protein
VDRVPVTVRFSAPVHIGPGTRPAFCTMGTGLFRGKVGPFRAEAKERVELNLYTPSGPLWPVIGRTYPFYLYFDCKLLYRKQGPLENHNASKQINVHGFRFQTSVFYVVDCHVSVGFSIHHSFIFQLEARTHKWIYETRPYRNSGHDTNNICTRRLLSSCD